MHNKKERKISGLMLVLIMVAGGMMFVMPDVMSKADAESAQTANMYVSTKYFGGPMVVEVVVIDRDIDDTDQPQPQPDVIFDGNNLVMAQASDGNWYAYVAHYTHAMKFDNATTISGKGFDFGEVCSDLTKLSMSGDNLGFDSNAKVFTATDCKNPSTNSDDILNHVVRNAKSLALSNVFDVPLGQLNVTAGVWPFIQTWGNFTDDTAIDVVYNATGNSQKISIKYDETMDDHASYMFDRETYPHNAHVHLTINDQLLNIDPTDEDVWTFQTMGGNDAYYYLFDENGDLNGTPSNYTNLNYQDQMRDAHYGDSGIMAIATDPNREGENIVMFVPNSDHPDIDGIDRTGMGLVTVQETGPNTGEFSNTDSSHIANLITTDNENLRDLDFVFDYADTTTNRIVDFATGSVMMDGTSIEGDWNSGEPLTIEIVDADFNKNSRTDDDFSVSGGSAEIPSVTIGNPFTLGMATGVNATGPGMDEPIQIVKKTSTITDDHVTQFSKMLRLTPGNVTLGNDPTFIIYTDKSDDDVFPKRLQDDPGVHQLINYDASSLGEDTQITITDDNGTDLVLYDASGLMLVDRSMFGGSLNGSLSIELSNTDFTYDPNDPEAEKNALEKKDTYNVVFDVFTFGQGMDGMRYNDAIYRYEAEETDVNTGIYTGNIEYVMLNQINLYDPDTYSSLDTINDELTIIIHEDLTDEDGVEMIYLDTDGQGEPTQLSNKMDAPTHSAVVSFDGDNYKVADTVTITVQDQDLNTDNDVIDIYTVVEDYDVIANSNVYDEEDELSLLLDVTFDDKRWTSNVECNVDDNTTKVIEGFGHAVSSLQETSVGSGIFTTTFQIPSDFCDGDKVESVIGLDLEVDYHDFRDASGEEIEVGDSAGVRANTGSISLDRMVYPVPFGPGDSDTESKFALHATAGGYLNQGNLTVHIRVNDPDFDVSGNDQDEIAYGTDGVVTVTVIRGDNTMLINETKGPIGSESNPIMEIAPDAGIFEYDLTISYNEGPTQNCPPSFNGGGCILRGDILQVEYTDPTDASGDKNMVTDSATFDLRNGGLQSDKSVYIIGSDMILTLIEPDFDLDNDSAETYDLDLIEWDSDAATISMGERGNNTEAFDPEPSNFRETGDSTGIFQIIIEIPKELDGDKLERGEAIELEYTDWGPSDADYVGEDDEDIPLTISTSDFGAIVELDQTVYTWTDKVYITVVAPDHNFDSDLIDEIGNTREDPLTISTSAADIDQYKLVETGTDTGIFTGEVILTGFPHDADGNHRTGDDHGRDLTGQGPEGSGPIDGFLPADNNDGLIISFEFSDDRSVTGSALVRWNIGEVQWLETSYPATGTGVVRVTDPDMNLNPEAVDNFNVDVWSDSDARGIDITVTETNEATGIFEGTVFFMMTEESFGHRLRVAEGDTVTAKYEDHTLPDPHTTADELDITATTLVDSAGPPAKRTGDPSDITHVDIGSLVAKSGGLSASGLHREAAIIFGVERFNSYLEDEGADWRLRLSPANILDTRTDTDAAVEAVSILRANNIDYIVGPARSSAVQAIKDSMDNADPALLVSCCSTAPQLAVADTIFRMTPADDKQGPDIARLLHNEGKTVLIPVWVNDPYGNGLAASTVGSFTEIGNSMVYAPQDDPAAPFAESSGILSYRDCGDLNGDAEGKANPTCDDQFAGLAKDLNKIVSEQALLHGADRVAVLYVGFSAEDFVREAAKYPALGLVQWVSSDATALAPSLVSDENSDVRRFLSDANFRTTVFSPPTSSHAHQILTEHLSAQFPGENIGTYVYSAHDAVWAIGLAMEEALEDNMPVNVDRVAGHIAAAVADASPDDLAMGSVELDEFGDLVSGGYAVYGIESTSTAHPDETNPRWHEIGTFDADGTFEHTFEGDAVTIDLGILLNPQMRYGSFFDDDKLGIAMHLGIKDWNADSLNYEIRPHTIDISDGPLPALNSLHHGIYDDFYHPKLSALIESTINNYTGTNFEIVGNYSARPFYPFVIDSTGDIIQSGLGRNSEGGPPGNTNNTNIDKIPNSDRQARQIFDLFGEQDGPQNLWWEYNFTGDDDASSDPRLKRSLLAYHPDSNMVVGAGYHPVLGSDNEHHDILHRHILDAVMHIGNNQNNVAALTGTFDVATATSPFYAFVLGLDGSVEASAAHAGSVSGNIKDIRGIDKTIEEINSEIASQGHAWFSYYFNDPLKGTAEKKRSLLEMHNIGGTEYLVGAGYYPDQRITYFAGPTTSGNLQPIMDYVNENDLVLISPSSTAAALAHDDNVFRLSPSDASNVGPLVSLLRNDAKTHVVILQRDDVWAQGLVDGISQNQDMRFYVLDDSDNDGTNDLFLPVTNVESYNFTRLSSHLNDEITTAISDAGSKDGVATVYIGFEDNLVRLLDAADDNSSLSDQDPIFSVPYYGTGAIAGKVEVTGNDTAGRIANGVGFASPAYVIRDNNVNTHIREDAKTLGINYTSYYYASAYDAVGLLADSVVKAHPDSVDVAVAQVLAGTSGYKGALNGYEGITLDGFGDLASSHDDYLTSTITASTDSGYAWLQSGGRCSVSLSSPVIDFGATSTENPQSQVRVQTITNNGMHTINSLDVFSSGHSNQTIASPSPLLPIEIGQGDGPTVQFETLRGKVTLARHLVPGESVDVSYRINLEDVSSQLSHEGHYMQDIHYRIACSPHAQDADVEVGSQ